MISVEQAKKKLFKSIKQLEPAEVKVIDSLGCVLAEDIYSPIDLPPFDNSAMDGYAVKVESSKGQKVERFRVIGEMSAGIANGMRVRKGEAVKINTGAMIPMGANAVLINEDVMERNGIVYFRGSIEKGSNIRRKASEISKGKLVFKRGTAITPSVIGSLSAMGFLKVRVYRKPKVSLIVTGKELQKPGARIKPGKIYDSNLPALSVLIKAAGGDLKIAKRINDNFQATKGAFLTAVVGSDIVIFCGGISRGDRDYVIKVFRDLKVEKIFYRIKQKPGKPLFAGSFCPFPRPDGKRTVIFGLPGNPAAAIICFYEYIYPVLRRMQGFEGMQFQLPTANLPVANSVKLSKGRASFLKGKLYNGGVKILDGQESSNLTSLAEADCIVYIPETVRRITKAYKAEVHLLTE